MELPSQERDKLYSVRKTVEGGQLEWKYVNNAYRLEADVFVEGQTLPKAMLKVKGTLTERRYSFSLWYSNNQLIRRWDIKRHVNVDGTVICGPHKHRWTEEHGEKLVYLVNDVAENDVNQGLSDFLKECNISLVGAYRAVLL